MDNLTHTLTGLMLSRAGLGRFHAKAPLILMLAANAPDIDGLTLLASVSTYFRYHRSYTHALIAIPLLALLPVAIARLIYWRTPFRWLPAWVLAVLGIASHLALDFTNPYGIRLLLPFNDQWPALSVTSVIDVWIWTILIGAAVIPLLGALVSSEIGAKSGRGRGWAIAALCLIVTYDSARAFLHQRAVGVQVARVYEGEAPLRAFAYPDKMNPFRWDGIAETDRLYAVQEIDLWRGGELASPRLFYKTAASPAIRAATEDPLFRNLIGFSRALLWRTYPAAEGKIDVQASDLYFGFTATAVVGPDNRVQETRFHF